MESAESQRKTYYYDRVDELLTRGERMSDHLDSTVITLASGTLALALTIASSLGFENHKYLLLLLGGSLVGSIVLNLISRDIVMHGLSVKKGIYDAWYRSGSETSPNTQIKLDRLNTAVDGISKFLLITDIILLTVFTCMNLVEPKDPDTTEKSDTSISAPIFVPEKPAKPDDEN